jgi:hypothetical protein
MNTQRGVIPLIAAILGGAVMAFSFAFGIPAALDGGGSGSLVYQVLFLVGAALVLAALVMAIVQLARGRSRVLSVVTLLVAIAPIATVIVIAVVARSSI